MKMYETKLYIRAFGKKRLNIAKVGALDYIWASRKKDLNSAKG